MDAFGGELRRRRERLGLSRKALAELCGMSRSSIERYERGEREPRMKDLITIAGFFGCTVEELTGKK